MSNKTEENPVYKNNTTKLPEYSEPAESMKSPEAAKTAQSLESPKSPEPVKSGESQGLDENRRHKIYEHMHDVVIEWNLETNTLYCASSFEKHFGYALDASPLTEERASEIIHPEDLQGILTALDGLRSGVEFKNHDFRILKKKPTEQYVWYRSNGTVLCNDRAEPYLALCFLIDINEEKNKFFKLQNMMERDVLTGIYNKNSILSLIDTFLAEQPDDSHHAIFIIDIDDFKQLNASMGRMQADKLLQQITRRISSIFRKYDLIGRFGGDEFVILAKDYGNIQNIHRLAHRMHQELTRPHILDNKEITVSCSIGISLWPVDGKNTKELLQYADSALCLAKKQKQSSYALYNNEDCCPLPQNHLLIVEDSNISRAILKQAFEEKYAITEARDGMEALEILRQHSSFSAILLDNEMPRMTGLELLKALREDPVLSRIPVIMITMFDDADIEVQALGFGVAFFIQKPFETANLIKLVNSITEKTFFGEESPLQEY